MFFTILVSSQHYATFSQHNSSNCVKTGRNRVGIWSKIVVPFFMIFVYDILVKTALKGISPIRAIGKKIKFKMGRQMVRHQLDWF